MTTAINSPTARDLSRKSIIELAQITYENALAAQQTAEEIAQAGGIPNAVVAAQAAQAAAEAAEAVAEALAADAAQSERDAATSANNALQRATTAQTYATRAEVAALRAEEAAQAVGVGWSENHYIFFDDVDGVFSFDVPAIGRLNACVIVAKSGDDIEFTTPVFFAPGFIYASRDYRFETGITDTNIEVNMGGGGITARVYVNNERTTDYDLTMYVQRVV